VTSRASHAEVSRPERPAPPRPGPLVQYALLAGPLLSMLDSSIVNVLICGGERRAPVRSRAAHQSRQPHLRG
jgi:hypothetical protein